MGRGGSKDIGRSGSEILVGAVSESLVGDGAECLVGVVAETVVAIVAQVCKGGQLTLSHVLTMSGGGEHQYLRGGGQSHKRKKASQVPETVTVYALLYINPYCQSG